MADEDDFLSRWSHRKRRSVEEKATVAEPEPETSETSETEHETEEEESALLERLGLPVPETLGPGDDFQPFMNVGVPGFLRRRALRVLWRSNPILANLDGLNDYDEDFTSPELTQKVIATAYQVGKGIVSRSFESDASEGEPAPETDSPDSVSASTSEAMLDGQKSEGAVAEDESVVSDESRSESPTEEPAPRPRRMRFDTQIRQKY